MKIPRYWQIFRWFWCHWHKISIFPLLPFSVPLPLSFLQKSHRSLQKLKFFENLQNFSLWKNFEIFVFTMSYSVPEFFIWSNIYKLTNIEGIITIRTLDNLATPAISLRVKNLYGLKSLRRCPLGKFCNFSFIWILWIE